jgi:hypothetical protein
MIGGYKLPFFVTYKTKDDNMFIKSLIKISIKKLVMDFIVSKPQKKL